MLFGPVLLAGAALVALVGWSRVKLHDHTTPQVIVGAALGGTLAIAVFSPFA